MYKDQNITEYFGLVGAVAKKYTSINNSYEDLFQEGCIGLIKAIDSFDESKGVKFTTYAWTIIRNSICMYLRSEKKNQNTYSLNIMVGNDTSTEFIEVLQDDLNMEFEVIEKIALEDYLVYVDSIPLDDGERQLIALRQKGLTLREISQIVGRSPSAISKDLQGLKEKMLQELV